MRAAPTENDRGIVSRPAHLAPSLAGSAAIFAALCALCGSRVAWAQEALPPPPPPPPGLGKESPEAAEEATEPEEPPAPPRKGPRRRPPNPDALAAWSAADTPPSDDPPRGSPPRTREIWYGHQTLLVDGVFVSCMLLGLAADTSSLGGTGVVGYFFGGPIVHWAHGEVGRGFGSLGFRLGLPMAGGLLGGALVGGEEGTIAPGVGAILGVAGAMVLDAAIAYEQVPVERKKKRERYSLALQPTVGWSETTFSLGLVGTL